jgi:hypothetical protein
MKPSWAEGENKKDKKDQAQTMDVRCFWLPR